MQACCRILVKVIPQSVNNIKACDESGGGNRISEEQIKHYLSSTLGDAPQPRWGVPNGWGAYLAGTEYPRLSGWPKCQEMEGKENVSPLQ